MSLDLRPFSSASYASVTSDNDPRLGSLILPASEANLLRADVVMFGVPTDEGIARNGGRVGASNAPTEIRKHLAKLTPYAGPMFKIHLNEIAIVDLGDIQQGPLEAMHEIAMETARELQEAGKIVLAIGGGHDITYPLVKGFKSGAQTEIGLINIDAHLDVRPRKEGLHHSGSSFRLLLEEDIIAGRQFAEIGIQPFVNAQAYFDWTLQQGTRILTFEDATTSHLPNAFEECEFAITLGDESTPLYLSFDMDAVRASDAPGVSAPAPLGFLAEEALELAVAVGLSKRVKMFDLVEVNPLFDLDGRTARLAARMIAGFLAGVANRNI
jgi:formiminoglutamase